jgi:hypothetical protein
MALHRLKPEKNKKGGHKKVKARKAQVPGATRSFRMMPDKLHPGLVSLCFGCTHGREMEGVAFFVSI